MSTASFNRTRILLLAVLPILGLGACESADVASPDAYADAAFNVAGVVSSVTGSGHISRPDGTSRVFTLNAVRHADGTVSGRYSLEITGPDTPVRVKGNITCLVIDGASAYIGGDVDRFDANPFPTPPGGMAVEIIDMGEGSEAGPDLLSPAFFTQTQQEVLDYCAAPLPGPVMEIERGNFQVR